jgi:ribosome-binding factor A
MAKVFARNQRVAEQMQRELADLLQFEVKDPRVGKITITDVEVSGDLSHAKIFYSAPAGQTQTTLSALQKALENVSGFLRSQLSHRMLLRTVPQLHFSYDASIDQGMKMAKLIEDALADTPPQKQ